MITIFISLFFSIIVKILQILYYIKNFLIIRYIMILCNFIQMIFVTFDINFIIYNNIIIKKFA